MRMTPEEFEVHQRRHGFVPEPVKAAPVSPEVIDAADAKAEMEIQGEIAAYLRLHDIHFIRPDGRKKSPLPPGWSDFSFSYKPAHWPETAHGVPVALEVKTPTGKLSPDQVAMHPKLAANGWCVVIVRSVTDVQTLFRTISEATTP